MSIPEGESGAGGEGSHDGVPLGGRSVDTNGHTSGLSARNHLVEEVAVVVLILPVLSALNVQPEHTNVGASVSQVLHGRLDLSSSVSARGAREDVSINVGHTRSPSTTGQEAEKEISLDSKYVFERKTRKLRIQAVKFPSSEIASFV